MGANFKVNSKKTLPLKIIGSNFINPIHYLKIEDLRNVKVL